MNNPQRPLWPPLEVIENGLFAPSDALLDRWARHDPTLPAALRADLEADPRWRELRDLAEAPLQPDPDPAPTDLPEPPPELADLIQRTAEARRTGFGPIPRAGQIVSIESTDGPKGPVDWELPRPLAVLLHQPTEVPEVWWGWLAAPETDYATAFDLLLTDDDRPFDPLAGMVQLWNPVHVYLPNARRVLAQLSPQRLQTAWALGVDFLEDRAPGEVRPGVVHPREIAPGRVALTGTRLGGADDPRHRYQQVYQAAAEAVREPARLALAAAAPAPVSPLAQLVEGLIEAARQVGRLLEPGPETAFAMGETAEDNWLILEGGLKLHLAPAPGGLLRLELVRQEGDWQITRLEDGRVMGRPLSLNPNHPRDSFILASGRQHRLQVQGPDGLELELPLNWSGEED